MKLTLRGVEYQSDMLSLYRLTIAEAREIKRNTHMTIADWRFGLITFTREDPDVFAGLIYLLKHRAGEVVDWEEVGRINTQELVDGFEWQDSDTELVASVQAERAAAEAEASGEEGAASDGDQPPELETPAGT